MNNFIFGIKAIAKDIAMMFKLFFNHPFFWGVVFGFFLAVLISSLVITKNPKYIYRILLHRDPANSFQKIAKKNKAGVYDLSYYKFSKMHFSVRILFEVVFLLFFIFIILAIVLY